MAENDDGPGNSNFKVRNVWLYYHPELPLHSGAALHSSSNNQNLAYGWTNQYRLWGVASCWAVLTINIGSPLGAIIMS